MVALKLFTASLLITAGLLSGLIYLGRDKRNPGDDPNLVPVGKDLYITSQLTPKGVSALKYEGIGGVVKAFDMIISPSINYRHLQNDVQHALIPSSSLAREFPSHLLSRRWTTSRQSARTKTGSAYH